MLDYTRTSSFQGLRVISLCGIVCHHAGFNILGTGEVLVSLFFFLSGFLYKGLKQGESWQGYVYRKGKSIFPVYWICLIIYMLVQWLLQSSGSPNVGWDIIPHLLLIQSWWPGWNAMDYLGPAWFLSSLWACYLVSYCLHHILCINKHYCTAGVILFYGILLYFWQNSDCYWQFYVSPGYRILEYFAGMCLRSYIFERKQQKEVHVVLSMGVLFIWLFLLHFFPRLWLLQMSHLGIIAYLYLYKSKLLDFLLSNKVVRFVSRYDIFIFLTHMIIFPVIFKTLGYNPLVVSSVALAWCLLFGCIYRNIESRVKQMVVAA